MSTFARIFWAIYLAAFAVACVTVSQWGHKQLTKGEWLTTCRNDIERSGVFSDNPFQADQVCERDWVEYASNR